MGRPVKIPKLTDDVMSHGQTITEEKELTTAEVAQYGSELAKEELQLDQVRKEKKDIDAEFKEKIRGHVGRIMQLSQAIDTGILTTNTECAVVLDRDNERKYCYPKDENLKPFVLDMTSDDFDLLT